MSKDAPCKNCSERHYGCHAECEMYIAFDKERKAEREKWYKALQLERGFHERVRRVCTRESKSKIIRSPKR